ncbi:hypothetical protein QYE76_042531 [Lolium multiflorum]|uniref:Uncharacterized protein n=1 Tax=Lolium multiflorum TaxID=4521 RepID=A0AAD8THC1_LOLMU|nr:hypothetical protein QYE76_042531 [Lolium multiflorum]
MASDAAASPWRRRGRRTTPGIPPPDMRLPSSGGRKMAVNGIGVPPPPPKTDQWRDAIKARRAQPTAEERRDPTWAVNDNDAGGRRTSGEVRRRDAQHRQPRRRPQQLEQEGAPCSAFGRTLENVIHGLRNGAPRLEMPSSPPASPQWQPRRTTYSSSSHSSSSGPARSMPSSSYRSAPYTVPKREVKEEPATPVNTRRGGSGAGGSKGGAAAPSSSRSGGLRAAFLASLPWRGDLDAAIAMSIRDSGKPLVDLTDDGEAGPSGLVKDEPVDEPVDERVQGGRHRRDVQLPAVLRRLRPPQVVLD